MQIGWEECSPIVALMMLIGLFDVTIWLAARSEVYLYMIICFCLADTQQSMWTAVKIVQLGIWLWASISKWGEW